MPKQRPSATVCAKEATGVGCVYGIPKGRIVVLCENKEAWGDWTKYMTNDGKMKITTKLWCDECLYMKKY